MGKFKFQFSDYNEQTGRSHVCLRYKDRIYHGYAYYNDTDKKEEYPPSSFLGCRIAERRAYAKALKDELKEKKNKLKVYDEIIGLFDKLEGIPEEISIAYNHLLKDISYREKVIQNIQTAIQNDINNYFEFQNKKKKKESCE